MIYKCLCRNFPKSVLQCADCLRRLMYIQASSQRYYLRCSLYPFWVGMDPTGRRKTQFPWCGSNLKSTQKRPSDRAKKYSWLREIDVLDYLAVQSEPNETPLYIPDGIKTHRQCFYIAIFAPLFYLHYKIIHLLRDNIRKSRLGGSREPN